MANFHDLSGASVFITGGGNGIGAALTDGFMAQGARVAFIGRSDASAFVTAMATKHGVSPLFVQGDITDADQLRRAMDCAEAAHGPLDVVVNNAANDQRHDAATLTKDDWDASIAVNLTSYFIACQYAAQRMIAAQKSGAIINYSSISYMMGMGGMAAYTASNAAITSLTKTLAREWGGHGIRLNAIAPGWVMTDKQKRLWATPEGLESFMVKQSLKQWIEPQDMVGPTLFLASDASRMVTGQVLVVDAGVV